MAHVLHQPADPVGEAHPQQPEQAAQDIERSGHPGGTCGQPAPPGRTSTPARLRGAARHAVTVTASPVQVRKARRRYHQPSQDTRTTVATSIRIVTRYRAGYSTPVTYVSMKPRS